MCTISTAQLFQHTNGGAPSIAVSTTNVVIHHVARPWGDHILSLRISDAPHSTGGADVDDHLCGEIWLDALAKSLQRGVAITVAVVYLKFLFLDSNALRVLMFALSLAAVR